MAHSRKEIFALVSLLSLKRIGNVFLLYVSYLFSQIFKKPFVLADPFSVSIEPNSSCNLHCVECATGNNSITRKTGKMNIEDFKKIIDQIHKKTFYLNLFLQGEPFLHPQLTDFFKYAINKKMFVTTSTNGHFFTPEICDKIIASGIQKIIVSMDGLTQETYEKYRAGGNLQEVLKGINNLTKAKKKQAVKYPLIYIQMLVNHYNEKEIPGIKKSYKNIGADGLILKSMQLFSRFDLLPESKKHKRYYFNSDGLVISKNKFRNKCFRLWSTTVITWNGDLIPCCYDKSADHKIGNINNSPFKALWKSKEFNEFRLKILTNRKEIEICRNCDE